MNYEVIAQVQEMLPNLTELQCAMIVAALDAIELPVIASNIKHGVKVLKDRGIEF